jgi:hypothetical protein
VNRRARYASVVVALAAVGSPVALHQAAARCDPSTEVCDPANPANPDHVGNAGGGVVDPPADPLEDIRDATRRYRNIDKAIDAGYVQFFGCVHEPLAGSMGIHFVNAKLAGDTTLLPRRPEALTYEVQPDGRLGLVGVEYIVFQAAWDAAHDDPPTLFGKPFTLVPADNRFGIDAFYALHAWAWKSNPTGDFQDWNPRVICTTTEGHVHGG